MPRDFLATIYNSFIRPHLDYADVIFDKPNNFSDSFLSQTIREWNKLDTSICQAPSYSVFRKALLDFIRPTANSTLGINDVSGLKYWHVFVLVSAISENINLNIIFKTQWNYCALVPLKQKTPITFSCAAKNFLINEMSFFMTLIQLTLRWVRMRLCKSYCLVIKFFLKIWILGLLHPQLIS